MILKHSRFNAFFIRCVMVVAMITVLPLTASAAITHILDDFALGFIHATVPADGSSTFADNATAAAGVPGDNRYISILVIPNTSGDSTVKVAPAQVSPLAPTRFNFSLPDTVDGNATVAYTGALNGTSCMSPPLDLRNGLLAADKFFISPFNIDHPYKLCMDVWFTGACTGPSTVCFDGRPPVNNAYVQVCGPSQAINPCPNIPIPFAAFGNPNNFSSVGRIQLRFIGVSNLDTSIDAIGDNCTLPAPTINALTLNGAGGPNQTVTVTPPCDARTVPLCFTVADTNATITVRDLTHGSTVYGPTLSSGLNTCIQGGVSVGNPFPTVFRIVADGVCEDTNATITAICSDQPSRVPSLNEWGMILLTLIVAASALWQMRKRRKS